MWLSSKELKIAPIAIAASVAAMSAINEFFADLHSLSFGVLLCVLCGPLNPAIGKYIPMPSPNNGPINKLVMAMNTMTGAMTQRAFSD